MKRTQAEDMKVNEKLFFILTRPERWWGDLWVDIEFFAALRDAYMILRWKIAFVWPASWLVDGEKIF
jgi:hypothetical protein